MSGEVSIAGVFVPALLLWASIALVLSLPLRQALALAGFYRLVWHRGLFDICLFVLLWGALVAIGGGLPA